MHGFPSGGLPGDGENAPRKITMDEVKEPIGLQEAPETAPFRHYRICSRLLQDRFQFGLKLWDHLEQIADDAVGCHIEDRCVRILVDGDDGS